MSMNGKQDVMKEGAAKTSGIKFWKMSGSGNDFILLDNRDGALRMDGMGRFVQRLCRRRESVGADGLILVLASREYDFGWRFFNADGGEVEMCGNGGRCVARYASERGIAGTSMTFDTRIGPVAAHVQGRWVKVRMPDPSAIRRDLELDVEPRGSRADFITVGVPHVVVYADALEDLPVVEWGRGIRHHPEFAPRGTNANFIRVVSPDRIEIRTYERGVEDETLACGTGSIAAALVAASRGMVHSPVAVTTWGGEALRIHFSRRDDLFADVWLEGSTSLIYKGELSEEAL